MSNIYSLQLSITPAQVHKRYLSYLVPIASKKHSSALIHVYPTHSEMRTCPQETHCKQQGKHTGMIFSTRRPEKCVCTTPEPLKRTTLPSTFSWCSWVLCIYWITADDIVILIFHLLTLHDTEKIAHAFITLDRCLLRSLYMECSVSS